MAAYLRYDADAFGLMPQPRRSSESLWGIIIDRPAQRKILERNGTDVVPSLPFLLLSKGKERKVEPSERYLTLEVMDRLHHLWTQIFHNAHVLIGNPA